MPPKRALRAPRRRKQPHGTRPGPAPLPDATKALRGTLRPDRVRKAAERLPAAGRGQFPAAGGESACPTCRRHDGAYCLHQRSWGYCLAHRAVWVIDDVGAGAPVTPEAEAAIIEVLRHFRQVRPWRAS
jgi:hypothetical protein